MAIYHLQVKAGISSATAHADYITREEKYSHLAERKGEEIDTGHGNMPEWAQENPREFWKAADENERKNGMKYREIEVSIPKELNSEQSRAVIEDYARSQFGEKHAYQWAIHGKDEKRHAHIMFTERERDGIERGQETYFKRANPKAPERGGCRKSTEWAGEKGSGRHAQRKARVHKARADWERVANRALERAEVKTRIDRRSYEARGLALKPQPKVGHQVWNLPPERRAEHPRWQHYQAVKQHNQAVRREVRARQDLVAARGQLADLDKDLATEKAAQLAQTPVQKPQEAVRAPEAVKTESKSATPVQKPQEAPRAPEAVKAESKAVTSSQTPQEAARSPQSKINALDPDGEGRKALDGLLGGIRAEKTEAQRKAQSLDVAGEKAREYLAAGAQLQAAEKNLAAIEKGSLPGITALGRVKRLKRNLDECERDCGQAVKTAIKDHGAKAVKAALRQMLGPKYKVLEKALSVVRSLDRGGQTL